MRMAVPISYNFLQLTKVQKAAIYNVMGSVQYLSFLGEDFNRWVFPIGLLLMALLTALKIYGNQNLLIDAFFTGRIIGCLGLKQYGFDQNEQKELADDGRYIIEQYKNDVLLQ